MSTSRAVTKVAGNGTLGNGNDTVRSGTGDDGVFGGNGRDELADEEGNDVIFGENGNDLLSGGEGCDLLSGGNGDDTLIGAEGSDWLFGGNGNDLLDGGTGANTVSGGRGDDVGIFRSSSSQSKFAKYDGGEGCDTLILELTEEQATSAEFLAELAAYNALQHRHGHKADCEPYFVFEAIGLKAPTGRKSKSSSSTNQNP